MPNLNKRNSKYYFYLALLIVSSVPLFIFSNKGNVLSDRVIKIESKSTGINFASNNDLTNFKYPSKISGAQSVKEDYSYKEFTMPRDEVSEGVPSEAHLRRRKNSGICYFFENKTTAQKKSLKDSKYEYYPKVKFYSNDSTENDTYWQVVAQTSGVKITGGTEKCGVMLFPLNKDVNQLIKVKNTEKKVTKMIRDGTTVSKKVLQVVYNPSIPGGNLIKKYNFNSPDLLTSRHITFFRDMSQNSFRLSVVSKITFNKFPPIKNNVVLNESLFVDCYKNGKNCIESGNADYLAILKESKACELLNSGKINEVWVYAPPGTGLWESNMAGPNNQVFDINSPPTLDSTCKKLLPIMGFDYSVDRGLHNFGHRAERTLMKVFNQSISNWEPGINTGFNRFAMSDKLNPGKAACGDIHLSPQSKSNYDYFTSEYASVKSNCHEYKNYPLINFSYRDVSCEMWGGCDEHGFFKFWWSNLPRNKGTNYDQYAKKTVLNNWWLYVFEPQRAIK